MSHTIEGYIAKPEILAIVKHKSAHIIPLPQGLAYLPLTNKLYDESASPNGDYDPVKQLAKAMSRNGIVVYVRTDYFGGAGEQAAIAYDKGEFVQTFNQTDAIDRALRMYLGVKKDDSDEFDALGLGKHRSNDDWLESIGVPPERE
jgi:hypothetical protein